jgi:1,4-dihydroxy-2-naphthoate octaprenyltransferase
MFIVLAVIAFAIGLAMHIFGWGSGKIDETLFLFIGLLCMALAGVYGGWPRGPARRPPAA